VDVEVDERRFGHGESRITPALDVAFAAAGSGERMLAHQGVSSLRVAAVGVAMPRENATASRCWQAVALKFS
jgi:hypothetical protein